MKKLLYFLLFSISCSSTYLESHEGYQQLVLQREMPSYPSMIPQQQFMQPAASGYTQNGYAQPTPQLQQMYYQPTMPNIIYIDPHTGLPIQPQQQMYYPQYHNFGMHVNEPTTHQQVPQSVAPAKTILNPDVAEFNPNNNGDSAQEDRLNLPSVSITLPESVTPSGIPAQFNIQKKCPGLGEKSLSQLLKTKEQVFFVCTPFAKKDDFIFATPRHMRPVDPTTVTTPQIYKFSKETLEPVLLTPDIIKFLQLKKHDPIALISFAQKLESENQDDPQIQAWNKFMQDEALIAARKEAEALKNQLACQAKRLAQLEQAEQERQDAKKREEEAQQLAIKQQQEEAKNQKKAEEIKVAKQKAEKQKALKELQAKQEAEHRDREAAIKAEADQKALKIKQEAERKAREIKDEAQRKRKEAKNQRRKEEAAAKAEKEKQESFVQQQAAIKAKIQAKSTDAIKSEQLFHAQELEKRKQQEAELAAEREKKEAAHLKIKAETEKALEIERLEKKAAKAAEEARKTKEPLAKEKAIQEATLKREAAAAKKAAKAAEEAEKKAVEEAEKERIAANKRMKALRKEEEVAKQVAARKRKAEKEEAKTNLLFEQAQAQVAKEKLKIEKEKNDLITKYETIHHSGSKAVASEKYDLAFDFCNKALETLIQLKEKLLGTETVTIKRETKTIKEHALVLVQDVCFLTGSIPKIKDSESYKIFKRNIRKILPKADTPKEIIAGSVQLLSERSQKAQEGNAFLQQLKRKKEAGVESYKMGINFFNKGDFEKALSYFEHARDTGIDNAFLNISECYRYLGQADKSVVMMQEAWSKRKLHKEKPHLLAKIPTQFALALWDLEDEQKTPETHKEIVTLFKEGQRLEDSAAYFYEGEMIKKGDHPDWPKEKMCTQEGPHIGQKCSCAEIFNLWNNKNKKPNTKDLHTQSLCGLGIMYEEGKIVEKDLIKAVDYFRFSIETENNVARAHLGRCLTKGIGCPQNQTNFKKGMTLLAQSAQNDCRIGKIFLFSTVLAIPDEDPEKKDLNYLPNIAYCLKDIQDEKNEQLISTIIKTSYELLLSHIEKIDQLGAPDNNLLEPDKLHAYNSLLKFVKNHQDALKSEFPTLTVDLAKITTTSEKTTAMYVTKLSKIGRHDQIIHLSQSFLGLEMTDMVQQAIQQAKISNQQGQGLFPSYLSYKSQLPTELQLNKDLETFENFYKDGLTQKAIILLEKLTNETKDPYLYITLGIFQKEQKDFNAALVNFEKAEKLDCLDALYEKGELAHTKGKVQFHHDDIEAAFKEFTIAEQCFNTLAKQTTNERLQLQGVISIAKLYLDKVNPQIFPLACHHKDHAILCAQMSPCPCEHALAILSKHKEKYECAAMLSEIYCGHYTTCTKIKPDYEKALSFMNQFKETMSQFVYETLEAAEQLSSQDEGTQQASLKTIEHHAQSGYYLAKHILLKHQWESNDLQQQKNALNEWIRLDKNKIYMYQRECLKTQLLNKGIIKTFCEKLLIKSAEIFINNNELNLTDFNNCILLTQNIMDLLNDQITLDSAKRLFTVSSTLEEIVNKNPAKFRLQEGIDQLAAIGNLQGELFKHIISLSGRIDNKEGGCYQTIREDIDANFKNLIKKTKSKDPEEYLKDCYDLLNYGTIYWGKDFENLLQIAPLINMLQLEPKDPDDPYTAKKSQIFKQCTSLLISEVPAEIERICSASLDNPIDRDFLHKQTLALKEICSVIPALAEHQKTINAQFIKIEALSESYSKKQAGSK